MTVATRARTTICPVALAALAAALACSSATSPGPGASGRTYYMGFSNFPPAPDTTIARRAVQMWIPRADAAILHLELPWAALLAGASPDSLVATDVLPMVQGYRSAGLAVVVETDVMNPLDRSAESSALVALGRSVTENAVQRLYRRYVVSLATLAAPDYLGLASETNLIRVVAPAGVYPAIVTMTNGAASDVRAASSRVALYVSVQVEVAWGQLASGRAGTFIGVAQDRADFPFISALGLSTYPYLGGFTDPSQLPNDYFARFVGLSLPPVLVTEGGWSSASFGSVRSSPALQKAWIERAAALLDAAHAVVWFQLDFTDLNLPAFGLPANDPRVAPFASLGLVDTALTAKPALAAWDSSFARPRARRSLSMQRTRVRRTSPRPSLHP